MKLQTKYTKFSLLLKNIEEKIEYKVLKLTRTCCFLGSVLYSLPVSLNHHCIVSAFRESSRATLIFLYKKRRVV